jgi:diguanylate cyclase (GGDEF)-like protein/PAS domain S-box-containing protein
MELRRDVDLDISRIITHTLAEPTTIDDTFSRILQSICEWSEWDWGEIWMADPLAKVVRCKWLWHVPSMELGKFKEITQGNTFPLGADLPGRIWADAKPLWITEIIHDTNFSRASTANTEGLHTAFGFPIINSGKVIGVMGFFNRNIRQPDNNLMNILSSIGKQIGLFIKWKESEEQLYKLWQGMEQSTNAVIFTDTKGNIEYVNPKFTKITGYTMSEVLGQNPRILKSGAKTPKEYKCLWETITSGNEWRGEFCNRKKNGELYWAYVTISAIKNTKGHTTHFLAIKEDITERKKFETHLEYLIDYDSLTNLYNRRRFNKELKNWIELARRYNTNGSLLFLDLDNFKYVNDTYGHRAGDELLINFAELLKRRVRKTDIIARIGGDEFAIILPYTNGDKAQAVAKQILELARKEIFIGKTHQQCITVSIGITLFPEHGEDPEMLLTYADMAMYHAKRTGRNRICIYTQNQKMQVEKRAGWEKRILDALKNDHFVLYLQPIQDLTRKAVAGYEALLRMVDEKEKIILPANFLDTAERSNLIYEIDRWVIRRAMRIISEQHFCQKGLFLEINISGKSFSDTELLSIIKKELETTGINPAHLIFEITETAIVENMVDAQNFINLLKAIGCRFALDDFGVGFASFSYLKHLHVDYLKIDGSFIKDLPHSPVDRHLVKAIAEIANGMEKYTIAECVENEETMQLLRNFGVHYAQGYYIGHPTENEGGVFHTFC